MTWRDDCESKFIRLEDDKWVTVNIDVREIYVTKGFDQKYERDYWDFIVVDDDGNHTDQILRVTSRGLLRAINKESENLKGPGTFRFFRTGHGKSTTYEAEIVQKIDKSQMRLSS